MSIRRQIEAVKHNNKPSMMTAIEWQKLDEIARSTIQMYLAENVFFSIIGETVDCIRSMGEASINIRKEVELLQTHLDSTII